MAIDTAMVIYVVERNEQYIDVVRPLFEAADRRGTPTSQLATRNS